MRWPALLAVMVGALVLAPAGAAASPHPLWHAFPLGGQPLIQRAPAQHANASAPPQSPPPAQTTHQPPGPSVDESYSVTFVQVIAVTTLLAAAVVLTPVLVIRRRLD